MPDTGGAGNAEHNQRFLLVKAILQHIHSVETHKQQPFSSSKVIVIVLSDFLIRQQ